MARPRFLRVLAIVILALLAFQFELGITVNLSPSLQDIPPVAASTTAVLGALRTVGASAVAHALLGSFLVLLAVAALVLSVLSRSTSVAIVGTLCFVTIFLAAYTGVAFTLSGFRNDGLSHGMATNFLLSFALNFVQVCILSVKVRREPVQ